MNRDISLCRQEVDVYKRIVEDLSEQIDRAKADNASVKTALDMAKADNASVKTALDMAKARVSELEKEIALLGNARDELKKIVVWTTNTVMNSLNAVRAKVTDFSMYSRLFEKYGPVLEGLNIKGTCQMERSEICTSRYLEYKEICKGKSTSELKACVKARIAFAKSCAGNCVDPGHLVQILHKLHGVLKKEAVPVGSAESKHPDRV